MKNQSLKKNISTHGDTPRHFANPLATQLSGLNIEDLLKKLPTICKCPADLRIAKNGELAPAESFFNEALGKIEFDKVYEYYNSGFTLIVQGLQSSMDSFKGKFISSFPETENFNKFQINAYITPAGENGFPIHWDLHEAYLLQLEGEKSWTLWNAIDEKPFFSADIIGCQSLLEDIERYTSPSLQLNLTAGEILYIPRGTLHKGTSSNHASMHITIGCRPLNVLDALRARYASRNGAHTLQNFLFSHMNRNSYLGDASYLEDLNFLITEFETTYES
ncbi:MAG: JmjC domain-containing protein [Bdellovibrio sp.]